MEPKLTPYLTLVILLLHLTILNIFFATHGTKPILDYSLVRTTKQRLLNYETNHK